MFICVSISKYRMPNNLYYLFSYSLSTKNQFIALGREICDRIRAKGYWADFIDPCSGLPMLTHDCNKVYSEVDGMECLLNYKSHNAGFCKILTHPAWGSAVYPATIFTHCPIEVATQIINSYPDAK